MTFDEALELIFAVESATTLAAFGIEPQDAVQPRLGIPEVFRAWAEAEETRRRSALPPV